MSQTGHSNNSVSQNLTETLLCPRQILEGNYPGLTDSEYDRLLDYQHRELMRYRFRQWHWLPLTDEESEDYHQLLLKSMTVLEKQLQDRPKRKSHASHELGAREFTFTYSPKWFEDHQARDMMQTGIERLCRYYEDQIIELRAVGEVGSNGLSHIHCFYKLKGGLKITDKNFKRAYEHWNPKKPQGKGFEGGHHANVKSESDFKGYIEKDVQSAWYEKYVDNRHNHAPQDNP